METHFTVHVKYTKETGGVLYHVMIDKMTPVKISEFLALLGSGYRNASGFVFVLHMGNFGVFMHWYQEVFLEEFCNERSTDG